MSTLVETDNAASAVYDSDRTTSVTLRVTEKVFLVDRVVSVDTLPPVVYLQTEFPTECWNVPNVATSVTHFLEHFFIARLPKDPRIEHVYWDAEDDVLKVWTVIPDPDFDLEMPIYEAQMAFMETLPSYQCDFYVIYRFDKPLQDVAPQGARLVL